MKSNSLSDPPEGKHDGVPSQLSRPAQERKSSTVNLTPSYAVVLLVFCVLYVLERDADY
jgi:hypothetical protein